MEQQKDNLENSPQKIICQNCRVIQPPLWSSPRCHSCGRRLSQPSVTIAIFGVLRKPTAEDLEKYNAWLTHEDAKRASAQKVR